MDVFESLTPKDIEVQEKDGHWWSVRIRPYKTTDHKIDGAVIALFDIDAIKTRALYAGDSWEFAAAMAGISSSPLIILDKQLEIKTINDAFCKLFNIRPDEAVGRRVYELSNRWNVPELTASLEQVIGKNESDFKIDCSSPAGKRSLVFDGRRFVVDDKGRELILLAVNAG